MRVPLAAALLLASLVAAAAGAQVVQVPDTTYAPKVAKPAFTGRHPVVMVDEAHDNYFTVGGIYRGFAALLRADGLQVVPGTRRFSRSALGACGILVVADACGAARPDVPTARNSAFGRDECDAVRDWVKEGGSLLLVADASPYASAMDSLARCFGVDMAKCYTVDPHQADPEMVNLGCILFRRSMDMLGDHAILRGRNAGERIQRVGTFTGQSLTGPPGSRGLLVLGPSSWDVPFSPDARRRADPGAWARADSSTAPRTPGSLPAIGRFQAVAFRFGRGRVVAVGEGAMLTAQLLVGDEARRRGKEQMPLGVNRPDLDNQQFTLNVVRWLGRALD